MKLTIKQQKFADEYVISGNAYQSAIKAGYSHNYARAQASKLLENVGVKSYIDKQLAKLQSEKVADQQEVMEFLTSILRGEITEPMAVLDGDGYQKVIDVIPSAQARRSAAELIGKRYGMWTDKQEIEHSGAVMFVDDIE